MNAQELKKWKSLQRRRETCRRNQQRFRDRRKAQEKALIARVDELKTQLQLWHAYHSLVRYQSIHGRVDPCSMRSSIVDIYLDLYKRGAGDPGTMLMAQQEQFAAVHFNTSFYHQTPTLGVGPLALHVQWKRYSLLHPQIQASSREMQVLTADASVIQMTQHCTLPIQHQTIAILYPHMASNASFMQAVVGQCLEYDLVTTLHFDANHQIVLATTSYDMIRAWMRLVNNIKSVMHIVRYSRFHQGGIDIPDYELQSYIS